MSDNVMHPAGEHRRRIRDLARLADAQRDYFSAQLAELSDSIQPLVVARNVFSRLATGVSFASRFLGRGRPGFGLGGLLAGLGVGAASLEKTEESKFPWKSVLLAGVSLLEVSRWIKHKRHD
jgi:hypothetical protein